MTGGGSLRGAGVGPLAPPGEHCGVGEPLLAIQGVSKSFGGVVAVRDLSAELGAGEIHGLIGPNGSGKTTLLNLIGGQLAPDAGEIRLAGRPVHGLSPDAVAALGVARTFQLPRVFRHMSVLDNLLVPVCADHRRLPWTDGLRAARDALELVGLESLARAEARTLSGGQAMLLQLARCLTQRPIRLCLLDEPFAGVHPAIKDRMVASIVEINRRDGITFLIVSHEMATLRRLAQRVLVMHNGEGIAQGTLDDVARDGRVIEAYLGGRQAASAPAGRG
jgi:ABC-type branched-subunit amino acid transport system ATPase component